MTILLYIVGYLIVGLVLGSATTRAGYALDKDVRREEASLTGLQKQYLDAREKYQELPPKKESGGNYAEPWYSAANEMNHALETLKNARNRAQTTFDKNRIGYMWVGISMMVFWAAAIPLGGVVAVFWFGGKLAFRGITYAFSPSRYDSHRELMGEVLR